MLGRWYRNLMANISCGTMSGLSLAKFLVYYTPAVVSSYYGYRIVDQPMRHGLFKGLLSKMFWSRRTG